LHRTNPAASLGIESDVKGAVMAEFSTSSDVERWLRTIEPAERRREVAIAFAARAALRILPLVGLALGQPGSRQDASHDGNVLRRVVLPVFGAAALAWTAGRFPKGATEPLAGAARAAARRAEDAIGIDLSAPESISHVATAAAFAADTVHVVDVSGNCAQAIDSAVEAAGHRAAAREDYLAGVDAIFGAIGADGALVESGRSGVEIASTPLWDAGAPKWASSAWQRLEYVLVAAGDDWEVWIDWYEARLSGDAARPANEALELARATIADEVWKQGPAVVNAEIKRLIEEHDRRPSPAEDQDSGDDAVSEAGSPSENFASILGTRSALRVLPLLVNDRQRIGDRNKSKFTLAIFRALAVAWANARYPSVVTRQSCLAAAREVKGYALGSGPAALHIAEAVTNAAYSAGSGGQKVAAGRAARAHIQAKEAGRAATGDRSLQVILDRADSEDGGDLLGGGRSTQVAANKLWPGRDPPPVLDQQWKELKEALQFASEGWEVWIDWYEARLDGRIRSQEVELAYVEFSRNVSSTATAWEANSEIKRLIERSQSLQQRPAAFQFQVIDDKIDALPDDARPIDPETARDFYDEAKRKGRDLKDRLQRTQADESIRAHVDLLLTRLGNSYADMRLGLMISVLRSLESDARAYDGEEGRKELSAAHLSNVIDLAESVRDLCAIFPRSREIEAEAVSLALPMQRMSEIREAIGSVVAKVNASDGATDGGRAAINASAADLAHQRGLAEETKQSAYFLVDFANFARAGVKHLKATGHAVGGEIAGLGSDSWRAVRRGAPKGIERGAAQAGKALVIGGVAALMHWLGSDIAALGTMVAPYLPLHEMLEKMTGAAPGAPATGPDASPASAEDADDTPAARAPKARKSKARKPGKT
jgi:hypothetical protein